MGTVSAHIAAPPEDVWAVLADGWRYTNWVVGTSHMRAVDARWPAEGAVLHHAVGAWPVLVRDDTTVERSQPPSLLVLRASGGLLGEARIELRLAPVGGETDLEMTETPITGMGRWLHNRLQDALLRRRNTEALARLAALCEQRTEPA